MTDQRNFSGSVVAFCSFVVAVCAVLVAVKVMSPVQVETPAPPRVLDQTALEKQVAGAVSQWKSNPNALVLCPLSVVVEKGTEFTCTVHDDEGPRQASVTIEDDQGKISVERN
ncbi:DUF4333 domain-containing protein [Streptomyces sp. NPDC048590]|uniref:DUF4333 domain-containing protein n=1 Tax=Streptomyces sp. NPDC048590 TaxID=3365574 RepID=UPI00371E6933